MRPFDIIMAVLAGVGCVHIFGPINGIIAAALLGIWRIYTEEKEPNP